MAPNRKRTIGKKEIYIFAGLILVAVVLLVMFLSTGKKKMPEKPEPRQENPFASIKKEAGNIAAKTSDEMKKAQTVFDPEKTAEEEAAIVDNRTLYPALKIPESRKNEFLTHTSSRSGFSFQYPKEWAGHVRFMDGDTNESVQIYYVRGSRAYQVVEIAVVTPSRWKAYYGDSHFKQVMNLPPKIVAVSTAEEYPFDTDSEEPIYTAIYESAINLGQTVTAN